MKKMPLTANTRQDANDLVNMYKQHGQDAKVREKRDGTFEVYLTGKSTNGQSAFYASRQKGSPPKRERYDAFGNGGKAKEFSAKMHELGLTSSIRKDADDQYTVITSDGLKTIDEKREEIKKVERSMKTWEITGEDISTAEGEVKFRKDLEAEMRKRNIREQAEIKRTGIRGKIARAEKATERLKGSVSSEIKRGESSLEVSSKNISPIEGMKRQTYTPQQTRIASGLAGHRTPKIASDFDPTHIMMQGKVVTPGVNYLKGVNGEHANDSEEKKKDIRLKIV